MRVYLDSSAMIKRALAETESRLAGLARGADDYLAKPFSPKELVARVRRMLARAEETRGLLRRNQEMLAEVERSRTDLRRLNQDLRREFWVKDAFAPLPPFVPAAPLARIVPWLSSSSQQMTRMPPKKQN